LVVDVLISDNSNELPFLFSFRLCLLSMAATRIGFSELNWTWTGDDRWHRTHHQERSLSDISWL
jgi:hypothetical protein